MRRAHFGALIAQHFSHAQKTVGVAPKKASVVHHQAEDIRSEIIIEDDTHDMVRALAEAREAASDTAQHLDDVVGGVEQMSEDREALVNAVAALPQLRHERRVAGYQPQMGSIPARKKSAKKKTTRASPKKKTKRIIQKRTTKRTKKPITRKKSTQRATRRRR